MFIKNMFVFGQIFYLIIGTKLIKMAEHTLILILITLSFDNLVSYVYQIIGHRVLNFSRNPHHCHIFPYKSRSCKI